VQPLRRVVQLIAELRPKVILSITQLLYIIQRKRTVANLCNSRCLNSVCFLGLRNYWNIHKGLH